MTATDADPGDTLNYSLTGGADQALFNLGSVTGVLTFKSAPEFEAPDDADGNNRYIVEVTVSDGTATDVQTLTVTVTDVFSHHSYDGLSLVYGSAIDVAGTRLSLFTNAQKVGYDSTAKGLIALGYFNDGFDVAIK